MSRKIYIVALTAEERSFLKGLVSKGRVSALKRRHAQILLRIDSGPQGPGWTDARVAEALDVGLRSVERVRKRLVLEGLEAALSRKEQRNRKALKIDGKAEAHLIALACGEPPDGRNRWTLQLLADRLVELRLVESVSYETVRRTLKKTVLSLG